MEHRMDNCASGKMNRKRIILIVTGIESFIILVLATYIMTSEQSADSFTPSTQRAYKLPDHINITETAEQTIEIKIAMLAKMINSADKHTRGSKTSGYLKNAISLMKNILTDMNIDKEGLFERPSVKSTSICSESYKGGAFGFPLYSKGFVDDNCNYNVQISKLVTVVTVLDRTSTSIHLEKLVASIYETINDIKSLVAINPEFHYINLKHKYPHVVLQQSKYKSEGSALNSLVKQIKTPYVLIARGVELFTNDSRIGRLVRELESLKVVAVGGAFRYPNGHWHKGCFQTMYRNYVLKYISGYDESFHECLFCDYIQGPFLTYTKYLKNNIFGDFNETNGLFEDWYLKMFRRGEEAVVCPDSMFHVNTQNEDHSVILYKKLMQKWEVFKMISRDGQTSTLSCEHQGTYRRKTLALSPCGLKSNIEAVQFIMRSCEEVGLSCELQEGTAFGAVKFETSLPWEVDYDIRFSLTNCTKCQQLENLYTKSGIKFKPFAYECCKRTPKLGYSKNFKVCVNGYRGDFTGHPVMESEEQKQAGIKPTKVLYGEQWLNFARNPGLHIRNRYGKGIYRHAEHYSYSGIKCANGRMNYSTERFNPCSRPGAHNCLDRYNVDGILSFIDLLP